MLKSQIANAKLFFNSQKTTSPFIFGSKVIFANMPDWNPAEIIGSHQNHYPLVYIENL